MFPVPVVTLGRAAGVHRAGGPLFVGGQCSAVVIRWPETLGRSDGESITDALE